jgi:hypothetical protein
VNNLEARTDRLEQCRHLLATMPTPLIVGALLDQITFETEQMGASELEQGLTDLLWDFDVLTGHLAGSVELDSAALIEAMDFRGDVVVLTALIDEDWRSPTSDNLPKQPNASQVDLLSQLLEQIEAEDICTLLQPHIMTGDDAQTVVQPLGRALADVFFPEQYLFETIAENGCLDAEPLKDAVAKRPDVLMLATLALEETFVEVFEKPYCRRLLSIEPKQIKHHAKVYGLKLGNNHWQPINCLLQTQLKNLRSQLEAAYRDSLNPCKNQSFESMAVLAITQFRLDLDIALGALFADLI